MQLLNPEGHPSTFTWAKPQVDKARKSVELLQ